MTSSSELPEWLDQSIEGQHCDLTPAILSAFVEAQTAAPASRPSVLAVPQEVHAPNLSICCDNFA